MTRPEEIRIAVIGSGKMGSVHARNITRTPGARLVGVAGGSGADSLASRYGAGHLGIEGAFARRDIDAVVISSPNRFHADHIVRAVEGGKAVLVEKPVDLDLDRVDQCINDVGQASDRVVVAFNRRFDPSFAAVHHRILAGEIGAVEQLVIISRDPAPPPLEYVQTSGGLFRDMMIHDFDMARHLVGDIVSIQASSQTTDPDLGALGHATGAVATLTATSGALVTIVNSRSNATGYDQRTEAFGALGTLAVRNPTPTLVTASNRYGTHAGDPFITHYAERYSTAYRREIEHLVAVARGEEKPLATLHDGRAALVLALAAGESAASGGAAFGLLA
ncbi:Gfo/Idh/MocA family protein [Arthrobacter dokdonensis]|uniref:Gfo/Idh/MocA family protein n=1 Tax=Arthrobacter dokdonellae TaxID=2211210 RepID=UPI001494CC10|nr:Gfo/Idh/MocA family oxidoreductase [Arthrobacter dokdonellae]